MPTPPPPMIGAFPPAAAPDDAVLPESPGAAALPATDADPGASILVVDDLEPNLIAFEAVLAPLAAELGVRLLLARSAAEALRHAVAEGERLAVVVLDVMMPDTDGPATARLIRARVHTEHVPVIFVTALDADRRRVTLGYQSGAVDYLIKPLDPDVLAAKVRAFVDLHRSRHEQAARARRRFADLVAAAERAAATAERAARASDARLAAMLDGMPDGVSVFDQRWRWTYVNPVGQEILRRLGVDPARVLGRELWASLPAVLGTRFETETRRAVAEGRVVTVEEYFAPLDAWIEQRIIPAGDGSFTVFSRDVTARHRAEAARRESEARLRPIVQSEIVGLFYWELGGRVYDANDAFLDMLGYTRDDLAAGRIDWRAMTPPEYAALDAENVAELLEHGAHGPSEKEYVGAGGRRVTVLIASAFLEGSRERGVCLCIDRTERARLFAAVEAARARAEQAQAAAEAAARAKSEFLSGAHHELRQPLHSQLGLIGLLELGLPGPLTEQQRDLLARLKRASEHLLGLVNDVLDLGKLEAGQLTVHTEAGSVRDVVGFTVALMLPQAESKGVRLVDECVGAEAAGVAYLGDEHRVRQIVVNLLSNSVKFTPAGGRITISCALVAEPPPAAALSGAGPWVRVLVEDSGLGIAAPQQAKIFDAFVQADQSKTRTAGGTGLGLTVSRRLARLMGGDLVLEHSAPGEGSRFALWLPAPG